MADVKANGVSADPQTRGDFLIALPEQHQLGDLLLALGQLPAKSLGFRDGFGDMGPPLA